MKFLESISYEQGHYPLLEYHQRRVESVFGHFYPDTPVPLLADVLPEISFAMQHKVRVIYDNESADVEFAGYQVREVKSIKMIRNDEIDYAFKTENRQSLQALFDQRGDADEILIIKNGFVTDSFYANTAFWDGENWYTPTSYLLNGTRRQYLLETGQLHERKIRAEDISSFQSICLINAMMDLGVQELEISRLSW